MSIFGKNHSSYSSNFLKTHFFETSNVFIEFVDTMIELIAEMFDLQK